MFEENIAQSPLDAQEQGVIGAGLKWCNLPDLNLEDLDFESIVQAGFDLLRRRTNQSRIGDGHPMSHEPNLLQIRSRVPEWDTTPKQMIALALMDKWFDLWVDEALNNWEIWVDRSRPVPGWLWQLVHSYPDSEARTHYLNAFEAHDRPLLADYDGVYCFQDGRPWKDQINHPMVAFMIAKHLPHWLERFTFEQVFTPKRVMDLFYEGEIPADEVATYCAHYPFLNIPPTPLWEEYASVPNEGSGFDVVWFEGFNHMTTEQDEDLIEPASPDPKQWKGAHWGAFYNCLIAKEGTLRKDPDTGNYFFTK
ncbi:hypothetical protein BSR28_06975 [Boudabousia liubingyangii]|uniref:hypothetical protein n=1 Tax=Boudabousia liubingyangii TaxID=1921764 RepID=UPI000939E766|nr:hypothetical protein [Boudabousia liubingyangii]OKL46277.1 hypothetical protein BSR28_06975 [Boudabousia liubingyangii]